MNCKRYPSAEIVLFYRLTAKFKIEGVWESWTLWGPHRTRVQERDYCSYWYCLSFWLLADAPQIKETNNSVRKLLLQYISGFISPLYVDWIVWFTIEVSWSMSGQLDTLLTEIICFLFGKKKKKKKTKQHHEFLPDTLSFTMWFLSWNASETV